MVCDFWIVIAQPRLHARLFHASRRPPGGVGRAEPLSGMLACQVRADPCWFAARAKTLKRGSSQFCGKKPDVPIIMVFYYTDFSIVIFTQPVNFSPQMCSNGR